MVDLLRKLHFDRFSGPLPKTLFIANGWLRLELTGKEITPYNYIENPKF